jgi:hypothetical protein
MDDMQCDQQCKKQQQWALQLHVFTPSICNKSISRHWLCSAVQEAAVGTAIAWFYSQHLLQEHFLSLAVFR